MTAIPYDPKWASVFYPGRTDDFFTHGSSLSGADLCAEMSRLAYVKDKRLLKNYLARADFTLVDAIDYEGPGPQFFVAKSNSVSEPIVVVAFRGTEPDDPKDRTADIRFRKVKWSGAGKVDRGFWEGLPDMDVLARLIPVGGRVLYTGHSLGGAFATLAAALHPHRDLYTFGSPRVGNKKFAISMHGIDHARYVDCCDVVTRVPLWLMGYVHAGRRHYINRHGEVELSPSKTAILTDRLQARITYALKNAWHRSRVTVRGLADHAPINYVSGVMGLRS